KHGYGKGVNACIDCRIFKFSTAKKYMEEIGADFIATGEVLGQRPMSQHMQAMKTIDKESGLSGVVVRPLCAKLMPITKPEQDGILDREQMLDIQGRSRQPQFEIADKLGISDYPCPAGGCLLTDKQFAVRMRDLIKNEPDFNLRDARMLRTGRHFRLESGTRIIVSRNEAEAPLVEEYAGEGDCLLSAKDIPGPTVLVRKGSDSDLQYGAGLVSHYIKGGTCVDVEIREAPFEEVTRVLENASPLNDEEVAAARIEK
ncbi:MAG: hypothetical protein ACYTFY_16865, partial [Planctomycetota bacterium]